jgi:hypothetical protein
MFSVATWKQVLAVLCLCGAKLSVGGCSESGQDANPQPDSGSPAPSFADTPCRACIGASCSSQESDCNADPACAAWLKCLGTCSVDENEKPDQACTDACPAPTSGVGLSARAALLDCGNGCAECADAKVGSHPILDQQCTPSSEPDACFACFDERCCETEAACDAGCQMVRGCYADCSGADRSQCFAECFAKRPQDAETFTTFVGCRLAHCMGACEIEEPCSIQACPESFITCWASPGCHVLATCFGDCGGSDIACQDACKAASPPDAQQQFGSFSLCIAANCH